MSTWHQSRALAGRTIRFRAWTIVTDPPGECRTHMTFPDRASAEAALALWRAKGDRWSYLRAPDPDPED